ncbi:glycosyltransferase family 8 protein [Neurospora crassa]|uniref:Glycogenin n=2 Tax=Neurospora crassa TaxID=5141 RepID=GLG_NEUCR|nr:glycogenin [Neurospora crassa OR74A]ESA42597.1 glycogenin [Neurospora crassa OR74A]KHE86984.1 glycosyltransferase family 8 protein [Neurospora crassa]CAD70922.1 related to glycogenin-2 beta [Neurospora crassa]|eukprot:XP_011394702.1 glycogenin [Neurospora crassa OR74A]
MAITKGEDVYASLLLNDAYLPGALVLAHSLRDSGTHKKLAILITPENISNEVVEQLQTVYDYVIPVETIQNDRPANLFLMNRPDLHSAFTKINLWKQTQFRKIVYIDADVVAYRAPDELFDLPHAFSAAPDIGWPDLFNTGVMVLSPNMGDYYAMLAMAERGISFDGADQGLLNMHFRNTYNRLSFTYNVTPSAHYQYIPAYKHFQSSINLLHFIGSEKPWVQGRTQTTGSSTYDEMIGRWWAVYDRHYRGNSNKTTDVVQKFVKGEQQQQQQQQQRNVSFQLPSSQSHKTQSHQTQSQNTHSTYTSHGASWDASRHSPPAGSKPEAANFPQTHYTMSSNTQQFVPPARYPSPPKDMWYKVPEAAPTQKPAPIFPWEKQAPEPTRVFPEPPPEQGKLSAASTATPSAVASATASPTLEPKSEAVTPTTPASANPWTSFTTRGNAWDDVPEINRYVDALQKHRRSGSKGSAAATSRPTSPGRAQSRSRKSSRVTDFPTEDDRPSLPVTPAPIQGPRSSRGENERQFPAAAGVPAQSEWNPAVQLEKLAIHQQETLQKLGERPAFGGLAIGTAGKEIPARALPFGSEDARSPTYVTQYPSVLSPKPLRANTTGTNSVRRILTIDEEGGDVPLTTTEKKTPSPLPTQPSVTTAPPSYQGPGVAFEKGEDFPTHETPALPTEEERDVLET